MFAQWFLDNISSTDVYLNLQLFQLEIYVKPAYLFGYIMFFLFLWAAFHLTTDVIMAFRSMFGLGNKKKKGGSH